MKQVVQNTQKREEGQNYVCKQKIADLTLKYSVCIKIPTQAHVIGCLLPAKQDIKSYNSYKQAGFDFCFQERDLHAHTKRENLAPKKAEVTSKGTKEKFLKTKDGKRFNPQNASNLNTKDQERLL